jgi:hypothetical protein
VLHPDFDVDEENGIVTWIISPLADDTRIYVWDAAAATCQAFGGALCGGIAADGAPGEFEKTAGQDQHLVVTQVFAVEDGHCEDVVNTVEWSLDSNAHPSERETLTAVYQCSGANALGWPLLAVAFALAVGVAGLVQKRVTWANS